MTTTNTITVTVKSYGPTREQDTTAKISLTRASLAAFAFAAILSDVRESRDLSASDQEEIIADAAINGPKAIEMFRGGIDNDGVTFGRFVQIAENAARWMSLQTMMDHIAFGREEMNNHPFVTLQHAIDRARVSGEMRRD